ncbi:MULTISPECIES: transcription termination/antitermination NusG family protein [Methylobacterium]|jgi:transcriptional antiterminator NusG|uniref:transcription termination/antitermination protein NusG n=1 Tax=Methylobacterium TaxID=407 RepID=UPI0008F2492A|nr:MULTISPECIES: transcription termination/antitermination NusG family protein [Methylobacterium]MBZ6415167.1 antitermination protein NusG [Methylobacterium sp.]MBK3396300.1 antitermination protein NusG [Methylobacterium ajmalii]MBK3412233.1 antitermination protein NusG [Methylobacterium ajmalii]MBK3422679.1 antitermination protein NusG [Methylobacterium ajmalii]SFF59696.1 transcriptional antiterminator NusG [Methylobacterium sp. yr596]
MTKGKRRIARRRREALAHDRPPVDRAVEIRRRRRRRVRPARIVLCADRVWLVAETRPRWAARAARDLEAIGIAAFDPREEIELTSPSGHRRTARVPLLHRLVFVGLRDDADLARVEAHPGVDRVLFRDGRAVVIAPAVLQGFADAITGHGRKDGREGDDADGGDAEAVAALLFALGDGVRVATGPLAALSGTVEGIDPARRRYRVALSLFGRETPVVLDEDRIVREPDDRA